VLDQSSPVLEYPEDIELMTSQNCEVAFPDLTSQVINSATCNEFELIQTPAAETPILESGKITATYEQTLPFAMVFKLNFALF